MLLRYPLCALFCYALLCNFDVCFVGKDMKRVTIVVCCHHLLYWLLCQSVKIYCGPESGIPFLGISKLRQQAAVI